MLVIITWPLVVRFVMVRTWAPLALPTYVLAKVTEDGEEEISCEEAGTVKIEVSRKMQRAEYRGRRSGTLIKPRSGFRIESTLAFVGPRLSGLASMSAQENSGAGCEALAEFTEEHVELSRSLTGVRKDSKTA
jgi:hypothetical protein